MTIIVIITRSFTSLEVDTYKHVCIYILLTTTLLIYGKSSTLHCITKRSIISLKRHFIVSLHNRTIQGYENMVTMGILNRSAVLRYCLMTDLTFVYDYYNTGESKFRK